jgi:spermidine synthase
MKPWLTLGEAQAPDGTPLRLQQRGAEFAIRAGGQVLMASHQHRSEEQLARAGLSERRTAARQVLIGGLGLGYTLRAALDLLGPQARVVVAELVPAVVAWNQGPLAHLAGQPLKDRRVEVAVGDVRDQLQPGAWDAVLLDVDNGPSALTQQANAGLYSAAGLASLRKALRPGGRLALWSAVPEPSFIGRLRRAGLGAQMLPAGGRHVVYLGEASLSAPG